MNVSDLRGYVRSQMEVEEEDLPDTLLDVYLQEAFDRTMAYSTDWPRNQRVWTLTKLADEASATIPAELAIPSIVQVRSAVHGFVLTYMAHENATVNFGPASLAATSGNPAYWSVWANQLYLWPAPAYSEAFDLIVLAHAQPVWTNGASDIPDIDDRLHITLAYYAISLAYARQEDEVLEATYYARWERDVQRQLKVLTKAVRGHPIVMHGGGPDRVWNGWYVNPPVGP